MNKKEKINRDIERSFYKKKIYENLKYLATNFNNPEIFEDKIKILEFYYYCIDNNIDLYTAFSIALKLEEKDLEGLTQEQYFIIKDFQFEFERKKEMEREMETMFTLNKTDEITKELQEKINRAIENKDETFNYNIKWGNTYNIKWGNTIISKKEELLKEIDRAIENKDNFIIEISNPNHPKPEVIANSWENLEYKKEYYINAYNNDLTHKNDRNIQIVDFYREYSELKESFYESYNCILYENSCLQEEVDFCEKITKYFIEWCIKNNISFYTCLIIMDQLYENEKIYELYNCILPERETKILHKFLDEYKNQF